LETKRVMILGIDGYLGWALALRMLRRGHTVYGIDNLSTRYNAALAGEGSAFPLPEPKEREAYLRELGDLQAFQVADITQPGVLREAIGKFRPDVVVHFAEQRAAPFSMMDEERAVYTMYNNIVGTMRLIYALRDRPEVHILKMGTMGEFGTPNYDIPEAAYVEFTYKGKSDLMPVPKFASSWYHWTKVHDTHNLLFANRVWGLTVTDVNQGPVYGTRTSDMLMSGSVEDPEAQVDERLRTRIDIGDAFGTVINKNIARALVSMALYRKEGRKLPLYQYGKARQVRGFISLEDSIEALEILINNPPREGEFRAVNQFRELLTTGEIIFAIRDYLRSAYNYEIPIEWIEDPRVEKDEHYYNPEIKVLPSLGFRPKYTFRQLLPSMVEDMRKYLDRLMAFRDVVGEVRIGWRTGMGYSKRVLRREE